MRIQPRILALALLPALAGIVHAQATYATITGTVTDPNGAVVPNAQIEAVHVQSNYRYQSRTNEVGLYTVAQLREGEYTLTVRASGFQEFVSKEIVLASREVRRIDAHLTIGSLESSIVVTGGVAQIETETSRISSVKDSEAMKALPLNSRAMYAFLQLTPGVLVMTGGNAYMRFAGSRGNQENESVDGATFNNMYDGSLLPQADFIEGFQEMRVDMANNSAEYSALGQVTFVSKSGTNELHGSLFDYYASAGTTARDPFSPDRTSYVNHSLGGALGGPVVIPKLYNGRNKTFFYFSIESMQGGAIQQLLTPTVPLTAWRSGDFSTLGTIIRDPFNSNQPFAGNKIPTARLNPVALKMQDFYYPQPNYGNTSTFGSQNFRQIASRPYDPYTQWAPRVDHRFSEKDLVYGRFNWQRWNNAPINGALPALGHLSEVRDNRGFNMSYTHLFSPTLLNEYRMGIALNDTPRYPKDLNGASLVSQFGITGLSNLPTKNGTPKVYWNDLGLTNVDEDEDWRVPGFRNRVFQFGDNLSWSTGKHFFKFGALVQHTGFSDGVSYGNEFGGYSFSSRFTGFGYSDYLLGVPTTVEVDGAHPVYTLNRMSYDFFATDDFKITPKLTLNLGLRYEFKPNWSEVNGMISEFDINSGKIVVPDKGFGLVSTLFPTSYAGVIKASAAGLPSDTLIRTDKTNFAPRIGAAYRPWGNNTVLRAGFGIFYDVVPHSPTAGSGPFSIQQPAYTNPLSNPTVVWPTGWISGVGGPSSVGIPAVVRPDLAIPYSIQYNFTIERQQWGNGFRASYVGTGTRQGEWQYNYNQPIANAQLYINKARRYPQYSRFNFVDNGAGHQYNGLTLAARRDFAKGLMYQFSWEWARDIGDEERDWAPEDANNRARERGVWIDVPTYRTTSFLAYELPVGKGKKFLSNSNRFADAIVGGWQINSTYAYYSGRFLTPSWNGPDPVGIAYTSSSTPANVGFRPTQIADPNTGPKTVNAWFNVNAFVAPTVGSLGSASKGAIKGPASNVVNMGLAKYFPITEHVRLRAEATATNLANHPNYSDPNTNISATGQTGVITSVGSVASNDQNGPRNIRFSLRLEW